MKQAILKYRINELLNKLSVSDYRKAIKIIPRQLNVSDKTFSNYRNIKIDDVQDIPHEKVVLLEKLFAIKPGELENFTTIINSIHEIFANDPDIS
jgi:hypothetical protein